MSRTVITLVSGWACPADWLQMLALELGQKAQVETCAVLLLRPSAAQTSGVSRYAAGLLERIEHHADGVWLAGWSMGGMVSLEACLARPELVRGVVLLGATPRFIRAADYTAGVRDVSLKALGRALAQDPLKTLTRWIRNGAKYPALSDAQAMTLARQSFELFTVKEMLEGLEYLMASDFRAGLAGLQQHALTMYAREDPLAPAEAADCFVNAKPDACVKIYEKADHFFPMRMPEQAASDILSFMAMHRMFE